MHACVAGFLQFYTCIVPKTHVLAYVAYCSGGDGVPRFVIGGSAFVGEEEKTFFTQ